jgi:hypothetical protein
MSDPVQMLAEIVRFQSPLPPESVTPTKKKLCPWAEVPQQDLHYELVHRDGRRTWRCQLYLVRLALRKREGETREGA